MSIWGAQYLAVCVRWFAGRPGIALLAARDDRLSQMPPERFAGAWRGLLAQSVLWGVAIVLIWQQAHYLFRDITGIWSVSAAAVLAFMFLGPFRRCLPSCCRMLAPKDPAGGQWLAGLIVLVFALVLLALKPWDVWASVEPHLPWYLAWVRPNKEADRALLLMPIWGCWGMIIVGEFCRPCERTQTAVAAMVRGCGALTAVAGVLLPVLGTWFYFSYLGPWQHLVMSLFGVCAAIGVGMCLCRWRGGLSRDVLLTTNLLVQLAFLMGFLHARS